MSTARVRTVLSAGFLALLLLAIARAPRLPAQSAVPFSKPGQEELTFWVNHNGLEQLDALGEVGFGDMARILMRRRSNAPILRELRDRFTFKVHDLHAIQTPDAFRVQVTGGGLAWSNAPKQFVLAAGHNFNLPLIVENASGAPVKVAAEFHASTMTSQFKDVALDVRSAGGYFLRVIESEPGTRKGRLVVHCAGHYLEAEVASRCGHSSTFA